MTASDAGGVAAPRPAPVSAGFMVLLIGMTALGPLSLLSSVLLTRSGWWGGHGQEG